MKFNKVNWAVMAVYPVAGLALSGLAVFVGGKDLPYTAQEKLVGTVSGGLVLAFLGFFRAGSPVLLHWKEADGDEDEGGRLSVYQLLHQLQCGGGH